MKSSNVQTELTFDAKEQPRQIVCHGEAFLSLCRRAEAGEIVIEAVSVGRTPGLWICQTRPKGGK